MDIFTGFVTDNLRWAADGQLWISGANSLFDLEECSGALICAAPFSVVKLNPATLKMTRVQLPNTAPVFGAGTVALDVAGEVLGGRLHRRSHRAVSNQWPKMTYL